MVDSNEVTVSEVRFFHDGDYFFGNISKDRKNFKFARKIVNGKLKKT